MLLYKNVRNVTYPHNINAIAMASVARIALKLPQSYFYPQNKFGNFLYDWWGYKNYIKIDI